MSARLVTVAATSPLTVRETANATPVPAKVLGGVTYTAAAGDVVLATFAGGRFYIHGRA